MTKLMEGVETPLSNWSVLIQVPYEGQQRSVAKSLAVLLVYYFSATPRICFLINPLIVQGVQKPPAFPLITYTDTLYMWVV